MTFDHGRQVADAVLYEGYVLYPYRASARKNRMRWQFGVLAPRTWVEAGGSERWWMQTTCLVEPRGDARLMGRIRFLHILARTVEAAVDPLADRFEPVASVEIGGRLWTSWEEGAVREVDLEEVLSAAPGDGERVVRFAFPGSREVEPISDERHGLLGRVVREQRAIEGAIRLSVQRPPTLPPLLPPRL